MPGDEPVWLEAKRIVRLNQVLLRGTTEQHLVLDPGLLESALARPQMRFHYEGETDIIKLGVLLIEGIGKNHCFEQANKRTAFHAGMAFMTLNNCVVHLADTGENAALTQRLIEGHAPADELVARCNEARVELEGSPFAP